MSELVVILARSYPGAMFVPLLRTLIVLALLGGPLSSLMVGGCAGSDLQEIAAPSDGIRLQYDLATGRRYVGHVRRGQSVQSAAMTFNRALEYDIHLTVLGEDPNRGDILVAATFTNVDIDWNLGPNAPPNVNLGEFVQDAEQRIQGLQVRFNVGERGTINHLPPPPQEGVSDELKLVIENVLESVEQAFLAVPSDPVAVGETWKEQEKRGREGKLGRYRKGTTTTTVAGLYHHQGRNEDVAKLVIRSEGEQVITTKAGSHSSEWSGKTDALFSLSGAYLAEIQGETREFDPTQGTTFTKMQVRWTKEGAPGAGANSGAADAAPITERQRIDDPCDPDYVGPQECVQRIDDPCDPDYVGPGTCPTAPLPEGDDADADDSQDRAGSEPSAPTDSPGAPSADPQPAPGGVTPR